ncbi:ABC-2 type transport system ATP-binding protein [Crossiella equi]|uniref:ABC-2 type transport system ATP-binding protein n=1 Tax=Crossiella equi TaxID=130796 RepID=A0ABS5A4C1_9PSEU|nr:ABC transporter ATP-binding protein [Crossiella equi]MBP2471386.1 ABC-2 type transport system ATP-binding protein [Crossiella equi]
MFEAENVSKRFGRRVVLDQVSFAAQPGQVTALVGHNGAGKTTLMRSALRLAHPESGRVLVLGKDVRDYPSVGRLVGSSLDASALPPNWTGRLAMRVVADLLGLPAGAAEEMLERVDLARASREKIRTYSLGMRQRLALGQALLGDRPVLLLDEPTNGLDPVAQRLVRDTLTERAQAGATVLVASHDLHALETFVDRVVLIREGRIVLDDSLRVLSAAGASLEELYLRAHDAELRKAG